MAVAPATSVAQVAVSPGRSITLVAIKPQAVEPLQAVAITRADSTSLDVRVRYDGSCRIIVGVVGHAPRDAYQGQCRAAAPDHLLSVAPEIATVADSVSLDVTVISTLGGEVHRWNGTLRLRGAAGR